MRSPADHLTSPFPDSAEHRVGDWARRPRRSRPLGPRHRSIRARRYVDSDSIGGPRNAAFRRDPPSQSPRRVDSLFPHLPPPVAEQCVVMVRGPRTATCPPDVPRRLRPKGRPLRRRLVRRRLPTTHSASIAPRSNLKRTTASATGARIQTIQTFSSASGFRSHPA